MSLVSSFVGHMRTAIQPYANDSQRDVRDLKIAEHTKVSKETVDERNFEYLIQQTNI